MGSGVRYKETHRNDPKLEGLMTRTAACSGHAILGIAAIVAIVLLGPPALAQETPESLFKSKCAMCHGPDGAGKTLMGEKLKIPDLHSTDVQKKTDADLKTIVVKGKDKMPAYETKLSKEQIDKLVGYIRDLAKKP
jgi:mono/diheme cytochrome c family protein